MLVEVREDLGIAAAAEDVPLRRELRAESVVVVELAVLDAPDTAVLVREGW